MGVVKAVSYIYDKQVEMVHPKSMKNILGLEARATSAEAKQAAQWYVGRRCPKLPEKLNHNICDAICLGFYYEANKKYKNT
jgi:hypothetical protein